MRYFAIVILFISPVVLGQIDIKELAYCASLEGDLQRLDCYDLLAQQYDVAGPKVTNNSNSKTGKWQVSTDVNPVDDSKTVTAMLDADSGQNNWGNPVILVVRCKSNETDLLISWGTYLGSKASVLTRIGQGQAVTRPWSLSTNSQATFSKKPIPTLQEMLGSTSFVAQTTPYNESPITAVFDTTGMDAALVDIRKTCGW